MPRRLVSKSNDLSVARSEHVREVSMPRQPLRKAGKTSALALIAMAALLTTSEAQQTDATRPSTNRTASLAQVDGGASTLKPSPNRNQTSGPQAMDSGTTLFMPAVAYDLSGSIPSMLAVADLRGNGIQDIVEVSQDGLPGVNVVLGNGDGTFQSAVAYDMGGGGASITTGDLNGDGYPDVVVANSSSLSVLLGNGDGTLQPAISYTLLGWDAFSPEPHLQISIADVNGDGIPDLVAASAITRSGSGNGIVNVLIGNGNGTFQAPVGYSSGGWAITSIAFADLNGDGIPDIVVANCSTASVQDCQGTGDTIGVLLGKGNGTYAPVKTYARTAPSGFGATVEVANLSSKGAPDIVVGNMCTLEGPCDNATLDVFVGKGDGTFQPAVGYDAGGGFANAFAIADLRGNGKLDVAIANDAGASVLLGNGDGTLQAPQAYFVDLGTGQVQILDVNNDGKLDLVVTGGTSAESGVLLGKGDGTFFGPLIFGLGGSQISWALVADVTGDGRPDLLSTNWGGGVPNGGGVAGVLLNNPGFVFNNTITTLTSSRNPAAPYGTVTYSAVVTPQLGGTAAGEVWFLDGKSGLAGIAQLQNNQASISVKYKTPGPHQIVATYTGSSNIAGSYSAPRNQSVLGPTTTRITTSGSPSLGGQSVTFTATITSKYGAIPNGETVTFYVNSTELGSAMTSSGVATLSTSSLSAGTHYVRATYAGDLDFATSSSKVEQVVERYTTTTTLVSSLNPAVYGQSVTFTINVASSGPNTPNGNVRLTDIGIVVPLSNGSASVTRPLLRVGTHAITAEYQGDAESAPSASSVLDEVVAPASTKSALSASPNPSTLRQTVTLTATVTTTTGIDPYGTVSFSRGSVILGSAILLGTTASIETTALPVGNDRVTATYEGSPSFTGSSGSLVEVVQP
jgi:hypothetical protein